MNNFQRLFLVALVAVTGIASCADETKTDDTAKTEERKPQTFGDGTAPPATTTTAPSASESAATALATEMSAGKLVYEGYCATCHQATGAGVPPAFPPLVKSDYLNADKSRAIAGVVHGLSGEITVNGTKYNGVMPPAPKTDKEIAQAMTYVLNSWGNSGGAVTETEVAAIRKAGAKK